MKNTLITRISKFEQYNEAKNTILWEDPQINRWNKVYGSLNIGDQAIFIANDKLFFTVINNIQNIQSILCNVTYKVDCSNDQFLQLDAVFPECISRVKANFQPFIHPCEVDFSKVISELENNKFVSYYIFNSVEHYKKNISILNINDRVLLLNQGVFDNVKLHQDSGLVDFDSSLNIFSGVKGYSIQDVLQINKIGAKKEGKSNNVNRIIKITKEIEEFGKYRFETFFSYYDAVFNKKVYNEANINLDFKSIKAEEIYKKEVSTSIEYRKTESLNQILYGPPGTGKTYNTINKALQIIHGQDFIANKSRQELQTEFNRLKEEGQVQFVTFHQSFSYEDFVEGIKPKLFMQQNNTDENTVTYEVKDGVFKRICQLAQGIGTESKIEHQDFDFNNVSFYKMSLGGKDKPEIHDWCLENNKVALGWGDEVDYTSYKHLVGNWKAFSKKFKTEHSELIKESKYHAQAMHCLMKMKKGDVVLASKGNKVIDAIGIIKSDKYIFDDAQEFDYFQYREVEWIGKDLNASPDLFVNKNISQQSIYEFYDKDIKREYFKREFSNNNHNNFKDNYVLIIDEINRGNVAGIFGELITLIEPDKRLGADNELTATLPYSGEETKPFGVPSNLHIIGTMNTADRSVEALDTALRRRFSFEEIMPQPQLIKEKGASKGKIDTIDLVQLLKVINTRIEVLVDRDHTIGHSYFMRAKILDDLKLVFKDKIIPLMQEYFYGDYGKIGLVLGSGFVKKIANEVAFASFDGYETSAYQANDRFKLISMGEDFDIKAAIDSLIGNKQED